MKGFKRNNQLLSLCGLNCGLCPMHIDGYCPGCGGGAGNQSCRIARCSLEHDNLTYCYECSSYPCDKYMKFAKYDSFITHQHYHQDLMKAKDGGIDTYNQEQLEKIDILKIFLEKYNEQDSIEDFFFYFTGHGQCDEDEFYYLLSDFSFSELKQTSLENSELDNWIRNLNPKTTIKVVDAS